MTKIKKDLPGLDLTVTMLAFPTSMQGSDTHKIHKMFLSEINNENDIVISPEFSYNPWDKKLDNKDTQNYLDEIIDKSKGNDCLCVPGTFLIDKNLDKNYGYAISNGRILFEHRKSQQPSYSFKYQGLNMGLEICGEKGILARSGIRELDLLLMTSCGIKNADTGSLKPGGAYACVDGWHGSYKIGQKENIRYQKPIVEPGLFQKIKSFLRYAA